MVADGSTELARVPAASCMAGTASDVPTRRPIKASISVENPRCVEPLVTVDDLHGETDLMIFRKNICRLLERTPECRRNIQSPQKKKLPAVAHQNPDVTQASE